MGLTPDLVPILNSTGLQKENNRLYQVILNLIGNLSTAEKAIGIVEDSSGGGSTVVNNTILQGLGTIFDGEDGMDGIGTPGSQGNPGIQGISGISGAAVFLTAADGEDGLDAIPGQQGIQGSTGNTGAIGPAIYLAAESGEDGEFIPGPKGDTGSSGTGGAIVQEVKTQDQSTATTFSAQIPLDATIPQNTEGTEILTVTITPTNSSHLLRIDVSVLIVTGAASRWLVAALFQDSTANALASFPAWQATSGGSAQPQGSYFMTAGTTSATTFKVRVGANSTGTHTLNTTSWGGTVTSSISVTEIIP